MMIAGRGNELPVSALPADGTYPTATARWEKRNISDIVPVWKPELCIQCGNCAMVCPHATIRATLLRRFALAERARRLRVRAPGRPRIPNLRYTLQVAVEDCTGCELCVEACPAQKPEAAGIRAINMEVEGADPRARTEEPRVLRRRCPTTNRRGLETRSWCAAQQYLTPLFEFSGACAGCGETPYLRLLTQLFGDRLLVANATGCSSIYGGNLPTTPWSVNKRGSRARLGQLALRRQRGVRARLPAVTRQAARGGGTTAHSGWRRSSARRAFATCSTHDQVTQEEVDAQRDRVARARAVARIHGRSDSPAVCARSRSTWCARACGLSVAMAGPTTSATAAWTTCWRRDATSTSSCSTPKCIRTRAARPRSRLRARRGQVCGGRKAVPEEGSRSDGDGVRERLRCPDCHGRFSRSRRWMRFWKPRRTTGRRSSSRIATASPMASTCASACGSRSWRSSAGTGRCIASSPLRRPGTGRSSCSIRRPRRSR